MADWTIRSTAITKNPDGLTFSGTYVLTNPFGVDQKPITEANVSDPDSWVNSILPNAVNYQNKVEAQRQKITDLDTSTLVGDLPTLQAAQAVKDAPVLTQDQIDLKAFQDAQDTYLSTYAAVAAATSSKVETKLTQQDVTDAYVVWKTALSVNPDAFLSLVPKDFTYQ